MKFLFLECQDFKEDTKHKQRFPNVSKNFQRCPKSFKDCRRWEDSRDISQSQYQDRYCLLRPLSALSIWRRKYRHLQNSFYFLHRLAYMYIYIFLDIVSSKAATINIFELGMRIWPVRISFMRFKISICWWDSCLIAYLHGQNTLLVLDIFLELHQKSCSRLLVLSHQAFLQEKSDNKFIKSTSD